ncbi:MAG: hypothetical protein CVT77_17725 [Alphaproteobacteria bacterium HGW-Alphaproteobacteria-16]|nr:MAG: hypothetical protein CVT77_17725 [Alphaproteobacteria bacterium HGW-Alphaproteobacteria-16]
MTTAFRIFPLRLVGVVLAAATIVTAPVPIMAQDNAAEARIRKIESEVRALQRKVFPGGDGRFFEPQIAPGTEVGAVTTSNIGAPATTAVTDILVRLDALEGQLRTLTARSEEQANALSQLEMRLVTLETAADAPLGVPDPASADILGLAPSTTTVAVAAPASAQPAPPPVAIPSPTRLAAVQEIAKPQTDDAGDDEYSYGFRLWNAGFYPEARQQLTKFVEQYPTHSRISFGRNLLGRAFLDDNLPEDAARWFLRNYQANKNGDRAPDSLLYLGEAMIAMKDTKRACIALAEFAETYPLVASGRLADAYQANRAKVTCS